MAWPSGTKASTNNVDQGSDKISLARADIKQNIDNVNSIIDEFNIASPSDGDVLQYSSSSGKWEQTASTSVGTAEAIWAIADTYSASVTQEKYTGDIDIHYNRGLSFTKTVDGTNTTYITVPAGTYVFEVITNRSRASGANPTFFLKNTDSSSPSTYDETNLIFGAEGTYFQTNLVTLASTTNLYIYYTIGSTNALTNVSNWLYRIQKIA
jgi:hypothetical protein